MPVQLASAASLSPFEYQPMRVFISVLFTAAAATRTSTSPPPHFGNRDLAQFKHLGPAMSDKLHGTHFCGDEHG